MRKIFVPALTAAVILGMTSTSFAAANPFSDVPAGHWAYDAVTRLTNEGVIEGYGDGTYRGNRNITRYEMAQMVARAMARGSERVVNTTSRTELNKLAAEFRDELDSLGVRVDELEKHSDMLKWTGKIEYTYNRFKVEDEKDIGNEISFQLEPSAYLNEHWTANAKFEAAVDVREDSTSNAELSRVWAEGDYDNFNVKLGRMELFTNEEGLVWDTDFSGAQLTFGDKFKFTALGGRIAADGVGGGVQGEFDNDTNNTDIAGVNVQYEAEEGLFGGLGWYYVKDDDFKTENYSKDADKNKANIWSANLGYGFSDNLSIFGSYARNTKADTEKYSWQAEIDYGDYDDASEKGQWSVFTGYRRYGTNVSFAPTTDDVQAGTKGWFIGAMYSPFDNVGIGARYFKGKYITGGDDADNIWGRVEFFF